MRAHIVFCPVCCTTLDIETEADGQIVELECGSCETEFKIKVDEAKFAQHSLHG